MSKEEAKEREVELNKFTDAIGGGLHQMLRAAGIGMSEVKSHERIREAAYNIAKTIERRGEVTAVRVIKKLQVAVKAGFEIAEREAAKLKDRLDKIEEDEKAQNQLVSDLEKRIVELENSLTRTRD